ERGWSGMLIEPSPAAFIKLRDLHAGNQNLRLVNAAVGLDQNLVKFYDCADGVSTTEEANRDKWKSAAQFTEHWVPQVTIGQLTNQFGGGWDLISIDTEGTSTNLFLEALGRGLRPRAWM